MSTQFYKNQKFVKKIPFIAEQIKANKCRTKSKIIYIALGIVVKCIHGKKVIYFIYI